MKLYYSPGACSLVVRIILNELGLSFEDEAVDLREKKTASGKNYRAINPKGAVPVLILDDGDMLTENQVILSYLADTHPKQDLLPEVGHIARYHTLEWMNFASTELHKSIGMFFNPKMTDAIKAEILVPMIQIRFALVDEQLAKGPYIMGEKFTLPDAYLYVMVTWAQHVKIDLSAYKNLQRFTERMQTRPAVIMSLKQEHLIK